MKTLFSLTFTLFSVFCFSQIQNSNEKVVADFYDASSKRLKLDGGKLEMQFRFRQNFLYYLNETNDKISDTTNVDEVRSAEKINAWFINFGFTNTKNFLDVDQLDFKTLGYKIGITYQHAFSKIYFDSNYTDMVYQRFWVWKVSASVKFDRFNNFDPMTNEIDNVLPIKAGFNGNISWYFLSDRDNWYKFHVIPTLSAEVNLIDYNQMPNYLLNSNLTTNETISFTSKKIFDGKYGVLDNDVKTSYLSLSCPLIPKTKIFNMYLTPIPYTSWETFSYQSPRYNAGFALGIITSDILLEEKKEDKDKKENIIPNTKYKAFNVPTFLSVGIDWNFKGGDTKKPQISVSGTFNLK